VRIFLTLAVLTLATLACALPEFPPVEPTPTPTPTPVPTATRRAAPSATAEDVQTAVVLPVALNVRQSPGGASTNKYLYSGDPVEVGVCADKWCEIVATIDGQEVTGFVYQGCLSEVAGELRCEAR
jgi:SH3-like domain-containing protein